MNRQFSLLIKPASFDCNLRCRYCFYLPKSALFGSGTHRMSHDTLEAMTRQFLAIPMQHHLFAWQGGEPTLMGVDFFKDAVALQKKYAGPGVSVSNAIQTNGTLLDERWAKFLHDNRFLVGISLDGPPEIHNKFRLHADGRPTQEAVIRAIRLMQRFKVDFNALTLVSASNQDHPAEVYKYLRKLGINYHQYIECVEFDETGKRMPFALSPGKWGSFLSAIFDLWYPHDTHTVSIRFFDSILSRLVYGIPSVCPMNGNCCNYLVIEHNGDVFPCDFHVTPELKLGNIHDSTLPQLWESPLFLQWGARKKPSSPKCELCRFLPL